MIRYGKYRLMGSVVTDCIKQLAAELFEKIDFRVKGSGYDDNTGEKNQA